MRLETLLISVLSIAALSTIGCGKTEFASTSGTSSPSTSLTSEESIRASTEATAAQAGGSCGSPIDLADPLLVPGAESKTDAQVLDAVIANLEKNVSNARKLVEVLKGIPACATLLRLNQQLVQITQDNLDRISEDPDFAAGTVRMAREHGRLARPAPRN